MESSNRLKSSPRRQLLSGVNMFFAILPDDEAKAEIIRIGERFVKTHRLGSSAVDFERLHVTVAPVGKPDRLQQPLESALIAAGDAVQMHCFDVTLDSAMRFSHQAEDGRFPFVLCADAPTIQSALSLRRSLADAQYAQGLRVAGISSYLPHVALLHGRGIDRVEQRIPPISWTAREFVLVRSYFDQFRYEIVARWPLAPAA